MTKQVLFIQGGSAGAYDADAALTENLRQHLGAGYEVRYPRMPNEDEPDFAAWCAVIDGAVAEMGDGAILAGHSIGGSVLIKWLSERPSLKSVAGVFAMSSPFWHDDEFWHWEDATLAKDAAARMPQTVPLFLYHGRADEFVPFAHVEMYAKALPQAVVRPLEGRNHQLNENLAEVARDMKGLGN